MTPHIHALETGLSADPEMFWRISQFDRYTLVSCSDPHSLPRIARECNEMEIDPQKLSFADVMDVIKTGDQNVLSAPWNTTRKKAATIWTAMRTASSPACRRDGKIGRPLSGVRQEADHRRVQSHGSPG